VVFMANEIQWGPKSLFFTISFFFTKTINLTRKAIKRKRDNEEWGEKNYLESLRARLDEISLKNANF